MSHAPESGSSRSGAGVTDCRRRHPRRQVRVPTQLRHAAGELAGEIENLSYAGVLIHSEAAPPAVGTDCELRMQFPQGTVQAQVRVVRIDAERQLFAVEIEHLGTNAQLLLLALLEFGAPARAVR